MKKIILGSASPRRKELLAQMGFAFEIIIKTIDEDFPAELSPYHVAEHIAVNKAKAFGIEYTDNVVITADTVVIIQNQILGKPADRAEAIAMIGQLSGSRHEVVTGVCIKQSEDLIHFSDVSEVYFNELTAIEIEYYVDNFKPFDKAGAYGVQDWIGAVAIKKIEGSYTNIMGLPTQKLYEFLKPLNLRN